MEAASDVYLKRQMLIDNLVSGGCAHQQLCQGVTFGSCEAGTRKGITLQIASMALQSGQLERVLERRFEQALAFDGCYIYLDKQGSLIIWHALPTERQSLDNILSRMLSLANLQALDLLVTR
ncbi:transcriptional regulator [Pseudomonas sp. R5-89-07]|uniref:transcriptional regulator n=1 Tax=Pseudomonas sp. R5-89-07 TaxID=658644 RepID=UPI000F57C97B|nr:transcriptional regulator [Pseudomonas sp. R5-89-07]AZF03507.1 negative regulator of hrp expression HrpV [Pseudomonas sp. R5-89-07]